jgi:hypothetical protein
MLPPQNAATRQGAAMAALAGDGVRLCNAVAGQRTARWQLRFDGARQRNRSRRTSKRKAVLF